MPQYDRCFRRAHLDRFDGPDYRIAPEPDGEDACDVAHRMMEERMVQDARNEDALEEADQS